MKLQEQ